MANRIYEQQLYRLGKQCAENVKTRLSEAIQKPGDDPLLRVQWSQKESFAFLYYTRQDQLNKEIYQLLCSYRLFNEEVRIAPFRGRLVKRFFDAALAIGNLSEAMIRYNFDPSNGVPCSRDQEKSLKPYYARHQKTLVFAYDLPTEEVLHFEIGMFWKGAVDVIGSNWTPREDGKGGFYNCHAMTLKQLNRLHYVVNEQSKIMEGNVKACFSGVLASNRRGKSGPAINLAKVWLIQQTRLLGIGLRTLARILMEYELAELKYSQENVIILSNRLKELYQSYCRQFPGAPPVVTWNRGSSLNQATGMQAQDAPTIPLDTEPTIR